MKKRYPQVKCIAIDVDGTLLIKGRLNKKLADWAAVKKSEGYEVLLWSAQGKSHAMRTATRFGIVDNFTTILSKPKQVVDDMGWQWVKHTKILDLHAISNS
jgi:predicted HAD superfamily phosphohydrolase YqeG